MGKVPLKAEKVFRERKGYRQEDAMALRLDKPAERNLAEQYLKAGYTVVRSSENRNVVWVDAGEMNKVLRVRRGTDMRKTNAPQNVVARVNGRRVYVFFDEHAGTRGNNMGLAINRANLVQWNNPFWNGVEFFTRLKAMASTVWSPTFALTNAVSDVMQTTGIMMMEGKFAALGDVFKGYTPALRAVAKWRRTGNFDDSTEMGRYLKEAVRTGVLTGMRGGNLMNFDRQMLDSVLKPLRQMERRQNLGKDVGDTALWLGTSALDALQAVSEVPEVGIRIAVYAALRKHGMKASDAALYAREITVDFNKKGEWTPIINTLYMFSNPAIQSLARWGKAWKSGNWKTRSATVAFFLLAGFFTQWLNKIISESLGDGDDDDEAWRNIPDYVWERGVPIMLPGGHYLMVPNRGLQGTMAYAGHKLGDLVFGDETAAGAAWDFFGAAMENFNFLNGSGSKTQFISPTILDPAVQLAQNVSWTGTPVHAEDYGNSVTPHWQRAWSRTSPSATWFAKMISDATGGDEVRGGKLDPYPEEVELVAKFFLGSIGTDIAAIGDAWKLRDLTRLPIVRGLAKPLPDNAARYYEARKVVMEDVQAMQRYAVTSRDKYLNFVESRPYLRYAAQFKRLRSAIEEINDARSRLSADGADTARLDKALEDYRRRFIDLYEGKIPK